MNESKVRVFEYQRIWQNVLYKAILVLILKKCFHYFDIYQFDKTVMYIPGTMKQI